jgi:hypothetical protein
MRDDYSRLKENAERQVQSWRWATSGMFAVEPLIFERHERRRGRWLKQAPANQDGAYEYGFDTLGRVRLERQHVRFDGYPERRWFYESFFFYDVSKIDRFLYSYNTDKEAIAFARASVVDQRVSMVESRAVRGVSRERYVWDGPHVVAVHVEHATVEPSGEYLGLKPHGSYWAEYDAKGLLDTLTAGSSSQPSSGGKQRLIYKRPQPGVTLASLVSGVQPTLASAVVDAIRNAAVSEPAYCIALAWDPGQTSSLPPSLGVGLESYRSRLCNAGLQQQDELIWNPAEFDTWIELPRESLTQHCQQLNQYCSQRDNWSGAARMLNDISQTLSLRDWSPDLPITSDFFVYAIDLELVDLYRNVEKACPPNTLRSLRSRGLLCKRR